MRRSFFALLIALVCGAWMHHGIGTGGGGGCTYDTSTCAWINAVVTAGGTVSTTQKGRIDTLITTLKGNSQFSTTDRLWLFAAENTQQAQIDLIHLGTWTYHGTPSLASQFQAVGITTTAGITGDGSTVYLDSNYNPATAVGGNFSGTGAFLGGYMIQGSVNVLAGGDDPSGTAFSEVSGAFIYHAANTSFYDHGSNSTFTGGFTSAIIDGSGTCYQYVRAALEHTGSCGSDSTTINNNIYIFAFNNYGGSANNFTSGEMEAAWIGGAMNTAGNTNFQNAINAYLTAWNVNAY